MENETILIRIDRTTHRKLKRVAFETDTTMKALIDKLITKNLEHLQRQAAQNQAHPDFSGWQRATPDDGN